MNLKKDDQVKILAGKDRGKQGKVLRVFTKEGRVLIEGINLFKKRSKPRRQGQKGETVLVPKPLPRSKVMLICKSCKKPTRLGSKTESSSKVRICKKCQAIT